MRHLFITLGSLLGLPLIVTASHTGSSDLFNLLYDIGDLLQSVITIIFGLALLFFFWGITRYILSGGNEEKRSQGKDIIVWGIIGLFILFTVWGLIEALQVTFIGYGAENVIRPDTLR